MELILDIPVKKTSHSRLQEVDFDHLSFGQHTSDHMLVCDYDKGEWSQPAIMPYGDLTLDPAALALHYGQTVFEGMKAFRTYDGRINIFRIEKHYDRFARSLQRMCMAIPPKEIFIEGLTKLLQTDQEWIPRQKGAALYIRPFIYASEAKFGIKIAEQYRFIVFTGPVPQLYNRPISVKVETQYIRAARGGTGFAKCGGNYGGAFYPTQLARQEGYDQVLWTTGQENPSIEESGMMNIMLVINKKLVTPPLSDSILDGVTRDSLLTLAHDLGYETEERTIYVKELEAALGQQSIREMFGAGTAAVVAPIDRVQVNGKDYQLPSYDEKNLFMLLKQKLERVRTGVDIDIHSWNYLL